MERYVLPVVDGSAVDPVNCHANEPIRLKPRAKLLFTLLPSSLYRSTQSDLVWAKMSIKLQLGSIDASRSEDVKLQYIPARIEEAHGIDIDNKFNNYTKEVDGCEYTIDDVSSMCGTAMLLPIHAAGIGCNAERAIVSTEQHYPISQICQMRCAAFRWMAANSPCPKHTKESFSRRPNGRWTKPPTERSKWGGCSTSSPTGTMTKYHRTTINSSKRYSGTNSPMRYDLRLNPWNGLNVAATLTVSRWLNWFAVARADFSRGIWGGHGRHQRKLTTLKIPHSKPRNKVNKWQTSHSMRSMALKHCVYIILSVNGIG